jgi:hypothetical protein
VPGARKTPHDFLRWFFLSSRAFQSYGPEGARRRSRRDTEREQQLQTFMRWATTPTWADPRWARKAQRASVNDPVRLSHIAKAVGRDVMLPQQQSVSDYLWSPHPSSDPDRQIATRALQPVVSGLPKILRYLGMLAGWWITTLYDAQQTTGRNTRS